MLINHNLPVWSCDFFKPIRFKVAYGGRGGGKSTTFAQILVIMMLQRPLKVMCCRQFQSSIDDSVKPLLVQAIDFLGGNAFFKILDTEIRCINGGVIHFKGIDRDPMGIKGWEGYDICWVEEANTMSPQALELLLPTIRKQDSQIWFSLNRHKITDAVDVAFIQNKRDNALVLEVNYYDNPYLPHVLDLERIQCKKDTPERYAHIWLGQPDINHNAMIFTPAILQKAFDNETYQDDLNAPLVMGVDPAREGGDRFVICYRRGRVVEGFETLQPNKINESTYVLGNLIHKHKPRIVFIDTGTFGVAVVDHLQANGHNCVVGVNFGGSSSDKKSAYNKRSEMYLMALKWLTEDNVKIKANPQKILYDFMTELCILKRRFGIFGELKLESKEIIKKELGRSPDYADAFALTFAEPVPYDPIMTGFNPSLIKPHFYNTHDRILI